MMDPLAKRVAPHEAAHKVFGQSLDDADFQRQAPVAYLLRKGFGSKQEFGCPPRQIGDDGKEGGGGAGRTQGFWSYATFP